MVDRLCTGHDNSRNFVAYLGIHLAMAQRVTIRKPDDWHLHIRDGAMLKAVLPYTAKHFGRAIVMPNLVPPVTTTAEAIAYRERVMKAVPPGSTFKPLMT